MEDDGFIDEDAMFDAVPWWVDSPEEQGDTAEPLTSAEILRAAHLVGPGPECLRLLTSLQGQPLTADQKLTVVQLWQPLLAWMTAAEQAAVLDFAGPQPRASDKAACFQDEFLPLELSAALGVSMDWAATRIADARWLSQSLPDTWALLLSGRIDPYRVRILCQVLSTLPPSLVPALEQQFLGQAATLSPAALRRRLTKAAKLADPDWGSRMFAKAHRTRRVVFNPNAVDGLVTMTAFLPPVEAIAIERHLQHAAGPYDPQDGRCSDERMTDALSAAVLGSTAATPNIPVAPQVTVSVVVDLPTLLGLRENTGELEGYGPLPPQLVRSLAADAAWQRFVIDPVDGHLLDQGDRTYAPGRRLDRYVRSRDKYCRFPGSGRSARRSDLDHSFPFGKPGAGACTSAANLAALSRRVHRAKTHGGYRLTLHRDATITWTTPLGRVYRTRPHDYRPDG